MRLFVYNGRTPCGVGRNRIFGRIGECTPNAYLLDYLAAYTQLLMIDSYKMRVHMSASQQSPI
jgi:hypothetical protein